LLTADVVVDLPVWALDRPLSYEVPDALAARLRVGSLVRVDVRGRRVRGWVVGLSEEDERELSSLAGLSGRAAVFDEALLKMARRLADLYIQPLRSFLKLFTPPRLGRPGALPEAPPMGETGVHQPVLWRPGPREDPVERYRHEIDRAFAEGGGAIVAVPEVAEGSRVLEVLQDLFGSEAAVVHSSQDPAQRGNALWSVALGERRLVLGGRAAMFAPPMASGCFIVHSENDDSLKEQRAPYYHAREAALQRAWATGGRVLLASPSPSLETLAASESWTVQEPVRSEERGLWPAVEVVDRPSRGLPRRVIAAVLEAHRRGGRALILLPRVAATLAGPGPEEIVDLMRRVLPRGSVTRADRPGLGRAPGRLAAALEGDVVVASHAALQEVERPVVSTAVALGVDHMLKRPLGTTNEEVFSWLWTLGGLVAGNQRRGRMIIETADPSHHVVQAVTRGDYHYFATKELEVRNDGRWPPFTRLVRLHVATPDVPEELVRTLGSLPDTRVLGPVEGRLGSELLLKVGDLGRAAGALREVISGSTTRILAEVDPRGW
jgi:primosomal protein N' (replication factor Y)